MHGLKELFEEDRDLRVTLLPVVGIFGSSFNVDSNEGGADAYSTFGHAKTSVPAQSSPLVHL
jgi:hypothetical protein